jgi:hypothetical protein
MPLTTCIECGASVSDNAVLCPSCRSNWRGIKCAACNVRMRQSEALHVPDCFEGKTVRGKFFHEQCLLTLLPNRDARCRDCGTTINIRSHGFAFCSSGVFLKSQDDTSRQVDPESPFDSCEVVKQWSIPYAQYVCGTRSCPNCGCSTPLAYKTKNRFLDGYKMCLECSLPDFGLNTGTVFRRHKLCHDRGGWS